ncbi:hypothetical protein LPB19_00655 [Marinobacter salinisoli]|uniref:Uncharacterized protein n=1 Tax=Marinobacter salinisoli TaxID=2769486 RepID=A0ABX7MXN9_9GAMM|nr:hypothetical protein [Marinobacter salinisoli]QSP94968.1 hypothetical protein LPB19_00655 [Marinobacter salinisoli]
MNKPILLSCIAVFLTACSSNNVLERVELGGTIAEVKQRQILDPGAEYRNAGKVHTLNGNVTSRVITNYEKSTYPPASARGKTLAIGED